MLVETFSRTPGKTGLHVGGENVQRFFSESICDIELHLGHLQILFTLHPEFWRGKPEIFDERLSDSSALSRIDPGLLSRSDPLDL
jgi:hypothetical protein